MMDKVRVKCADCGVFFETWLHRGEVAPAICLGCWWIPADKRCQAPSAQEAAALDDETAESGQRPISDVHQVEDYFDPNSGWVKRGKE